MKRFSLLIGVFILLMACRETMPEAIHVIDLQSSRQEQEMKLSELCKDIRIVPLETTAAALLPGHFRYWCGEKYIVVSTDEALLQFSTTGKFIRILAIKGRAPEEFIRVTAFTVNEKTGRLYYTDDNCPDKIRVFDLNEGHRLEDIPMKNALASYLYMPDEKTLCGIALEMIYTPYFYYKVSTTGNIQDTVLKQKNIRGSVLMGTSSPYVREINGEVHFRNSYLDTLYTVKDGKTYPWCTWELKKRTKEDENSYKGETVTVLWETNEWLFLGKNRQKVKSKDNAIISYTEIEANFVINKEDYQARRLSALYIDPLGESQEFCPAFKVCDQTVSFSLPALNLLKTYIEHPERLSPEVKSICEQLTEDSNPLLIIATLK